VDSLALWLIDNFVLNLTLANLQVLLVPSAFTKVTGQAHWEILLRARAIETQCYV
jgi:predicted amidohydrolase